MATYTLSFFVCEKQVERNVNADIHYGFSSYSYKRLVDDEISKWLLTNKLNAKSTKIMDIKLLNESKEQMFTQKNWSDYTTISHIDFDEKTNSELIDIKIDKDFC